MWKPQCALAADLRKIPDTFAGLFSGLPRKRRAELSLLLQAHHARRFVPRGSGTDEAALMERSVRTAEIP